MIERVYECARRSHAERVIVATDDERVLSVVEGFGGEVCMTSNDHPSGTDRLQEVIEYYGFDDDDVVVNVQGDEPLIPPSVIDQVAANLAANRTASAATLCEPVVDYDSAASTNAVKVVRDQQNFALYFSRALIPWDREHYVQAAKEGDLVHELTRRHIGIYAYRVKLLNQFVQWPTSALEQIEKLEQLRILANGLKIHVEDACELVPGGVDTPEDLARIRAQLDR